VKLRRMSECNGATIGRLEFGDHWCFTLEDIERSVKVPGETCIPAGRYAIRLKAFGGMYERCLARFSWNAPGMLWLQDVPGFTDVLVHPGNTNKDTSGCILVGEQVTLDGKLVASATAYERVYMYAVKNLDQLHIEVA
jgi:hypothetical protein